MKIALLGPLEVRAGSGAPVEVGGARLRTLLIRLALDPGRVVTTSTLIDALWDDEPPAGAANALQALVSRLRRALPEGTVESTPAGYRLAVPPEAVDMCRFERGVTAGRARLATDPAGAAELLAAALALWRGPALADVLEADFAQAPAARLNELRLAAIEDRVDAALALGDGAGLVPELESLALAHPLRERLAGQLIRVLRRAGRPAEALAAYDRLRTALADSLGTDPSPELAALHLALLKDTAAAPHEPLPATNLPATLTSFVGRDDDVTKVTKVVAESRLTTLIGPGGAGKTRLAMESARAMVDQAPDGIWLVEFAPVTDAAELASIVLATLGLREHPLVTTGRGRVPQETVDPLTRLHGALGGRRALLVLDNCEHLVGAAATLAESLLVRCPHLRVLATSREPLGITGEALFPVEPLALPPDGAAAGDALAYPAVRLFADRAAAVRPGFAVTDSVVRICRALDGMPLAIELAAARLRALTPDQVADRLTDRFRLLTAGSRTALPRHQTLRAVIDWSWELLDDAERTLWRRLAVFSGPATLEAVEEVCGGEALDELAALVDKSLVVADPDGRYRMLETIKAYGLERLDESGTTRATRQAHARYFLRLARRADRELRGREQLEWLARLDADHDNLHAAARWAITAGEARLAVGFASALGWYWWLSGRRAEGAELALEALALPATAIPRPALALAKSVAALNVVAGLFQLERGQELLREAAELARGYEDRHPILALIRPICDLIAGPPADKQALPALAGLFTHTDPWIRGVARLMYGHSEVNSGHSDRHSEEHFTAALAEFRALGDRWGTATTLGGLAHMTTTEGDHARAAAYFEQALEEMLPLGAAEDVPEMQARYAYELWMLGETERAFATLDEARRAAERVGTDEGRAAVAYHHGEILRAMGEFTSARAELARAEAVANGFGSAQQWVALIGAAIGQIDAAEGDLAAARARHDAALELATSSRDMPVVGLVVMAYADLALHSGEPEKVAAFLGAAHGVRGGPDRSTMDTRRLEAAARERLGEERFTEAFERGRTTAKAVDVREAVRVILAA
ncbi:BTAD domain-containing putative transcriptional regulator [Phytohabitans sp. ZYX-F-186]|uniref:BTAD domain-containing putative transcriptional regulator n=1 Tax=Phytohabitans maris TaxID=3071409 RepID=A0ABU0ZS20_9ACTN|nr:BTAD domain-containing putative transcriptional regulator [Phytohabitans sp. ZYX-F-186]MDQ7909807.1 BTAD domain-containing putative transcriptional regulator [Phytohabitans sp. ZYX-F-186]